MQPCCYFSGSGSGDYVLMSNPVYKALIGLVVVFFFLKRGKRPSISYNTFSEMWAVIQRSGSRDCMCALC